MANLLLLGFWLITGLVGPTRLTLLYLVMTAIIIKLFFTSRRRSFGEIVGNNNTTFYVVFAMFLVTFLMAWLNPTQPETLTLWQKAKAFANHLAGNGPAPQLLPTWYQWIWGWVNYLLFSDTQGWWSGTTIWYGIATIVSIPLSFWDEFVGGMEKVWHKHNSNTGVRFSLGKLVEAEFIGEALWAGLVHAFKFIIGIR